MKVDKEEIYKSLLLKNGKTNQLIMLFEESAELQKEVCKDLRGKGNKADIAEEVADVLIMCEQVIRIYNIETEVNTLKDYKLCRLLNRMMRGEE